MKKRNKIMALLLAMTMCGSVLAGCGAKEKESSESTKQTSNTEVSTQQSVATSSSEVVEEPLKNVDIYPLDCDKTFTVITTHASIADGSSTITERMEEATGVKIEWVQMAKEQWQLALSSKEFPDAVWGETIDKATAYEYGQAGYFVNFMDYLDIMPNFKAAIEANPDMLKAAQNEDGSVYILPQKVKTSTADSNILYYRTDMMKEIGWENPPATTDEFLQYIKELQAHFGAKDPEFIAFSGYSKAHISWPGNYFASYLFASFGPLVSTKFTVDPDGNVVLGAATEQFKHYLEFMNEVWNSGAFDTNIFTLEAATAQAMAAGNHVGITGAHNGHSLSQFESGTFDLDVMPPLTSEYWDTPHWYTSPSTKISPAYMVTTECEDIETMVKWFDAWYSTYDNPLDEEGTLFGITPWLGKVGTDYFFDEDTLVYSEMEHEGIEMGTFMAKECFGSPIYPGYDNGIFPYSQDRNTNLGVKGFGIAENLLPYAEESPNLTSYTMTTEDGDEYARIWNDIQAFIEEWYAQFISGERSVADDWDDYLAELDKIGLQTVTKILQKYYDAENK